MPKCQDKNTILNSQGKIVSPDSSYSKTARLEYSQKLKHKKMSLKTTLEVFNNHCSLLSLNISGRNSPVESQPTVLESSCILDREQLWEAGIFADVLATKGF